MAPRLAACAAAVLGAALTPPSSAQELQPIQVSPHAWYVQGDAGMATPANRAFNANAGFVVTDDGVVVVDALGTPALGEALKRAVARVTPQPIRTVIVTHYHADHFYGLQALKGPGVEVWAHGHGRATLGDPATEERLAQRRRDLAPYVDAQTRLVPADRWLELPRGGETAFTQGGVRFRVIDVSGAHSPEDLMVWVEGERVLFAGDLYFSGRLPFVGNADSRAWLAAMERITPLGAAVVVPGHGRASTDPAPDMALTRDYLRFLREQMGAAVRDMTPFDDAYRQVDWAPYAKVPAFEAANRINAYGVYLRMEQEALIR